MTSPSRRGFILPMIGLVLLFALLGPPVGGAVFFPLAIALKPPVAADTLALSTLVAAFLGHTIALVAAYIVGIGPAAATGFLYAAWDAVAPPRWPRALVASIIGGAIAYGIVSQLAAAGASVDMTLQDNAGVVSFGGLDTMFSGEMPRGMESALKGAFVASAAAAGLVCAMTASLLGLTVKQTPQSVQPLGTA